MKTGAVIRPAKLIVHSLQHIFWHRSFTNVPPAIRRSWNALVGAKEKRAKKDGLRKKKALEKERGCKRCAGVKNALE
jgi:hypothetical protein